MRQTLIVLCGYPFTGKTTIGELLQQKLGIPFLAVDRFRVSIFGRTELDRVKDHHQLSRAYPAMEAAARALLGLGDSVMMEGTFSRTSSQMNADAMADEHNAVLKVLFFQICGFGEARIVEERATQRTSNHASAARSADDYWRVKERFEPLIVPHHVLDTSRPIDECFAEALAYITAP